MSKRKSIEPASTAVSTLTQSEIAVRAYEIFLKRGSQHGHSVEDWLQAERELMTGREQRRIARSLPLGLRLLE